MNKKILVLMIASALTSAAPIYVQAQGQPQQGTPDAVVIYVVPESDGGFSAKKTFIGKAVYNEKNQKLGNITDLLIAPDTSLAYVVIGAGGFVGLGRHNVAVRTADLQVNNDKFILPGATKESLKAAPKLEYPKRGKS